MHGACSSTPSNTNRAAPQQGESCFWCPAYAPACSSMWNQACKDHCSLMCQPWGLVFPQGLSQGKLSPQSSDAPAKPAHPRASPRAPGLKSGCDLRIESGTLLLPPVPHN